MLWKTKRRKNQQHHGWILRNLLSQTPPYPAAAATLRAPRPLADLSLLPAARQALLPWRTAQTNGVQQSKSKQDPQTVGVFLGGFLLHKSSDKSSQNNSKKNNILLKRKMYLPHLQWCLWNPRCTVFNCRLGAAKTLAKHQIIENKRNTHLETS